MEIYRDPDKIINASIGDHFSIAIQSIPTTGYIWQLESGTQALVCVSRSFKPASSAVGGGGEDVFEFEVLEGFSGKLCFNKKREWEKLPKDTCCFIVDVSDT